MAEGVKLYCQETWRTTFGSEGKAMVERYIDGVVGYYVECTSADNHAVREAACHCVAELAAKIDRAVLAPHVQTLLRTLLECFQDDSWYEVLKVRPVKLLFGGQIQMDHPVLTN